MSTKYYLQLLLLLAVLVSTTLATYYNTWTPSYYKKPGSPCTPYLRKPCGERKVIGTSYLPCTNCRGQNVCKKVTTFQKHFYSCVYKKKCYKRFWSHYCRYSCVQTDNCDFIKTTTSTEYTCCKGYTTAPSPTDYHHYYYSRSSYYLKKTGCPRAIVNTTLQCLNELGLTELASLIADLPIEDTLNNGQGPFTIFAPTNEILMQASSLIETYSEAVLHTIIKSHIVGDDLPAVKLYDGQKRRSLASGRFIHVTEIELKRLRSFRYEYYERIFINGQELITRDACIATNGRVHIIKGIIDSSNKTISQVVQASHNLTNLTSLLTTVNLIGYLNKPLPLLTLFAPTDTAFNTASCDLGLDLLTCLRAPVNRNVLKKFLLYHVTCGAEYSGSMVLRSKLVTKSCHTKRYPYYRFYKYYTRKYYKVCKKVKVEVKNDGGITVGDGSLLTHLDIPASNGVVHYVSLPLVNPWVNLREVCKGFPKAGGRNVAPPPPPLIHPPPHNY